MDDEERYRLTHELYMLYQMRYRGGSPIYSLPRADADAARSALMKRECELLYQLGYAKREGNDT